jgi:hypothetical protein
MNTVETSGAGLTDPRVVASVRWRFRICNYLFNLAGAWLLLGALVRLFDHEDTMIFTAILVTGFGIFWSACALTLAIYRCPVCDKYIRRFRPSKEHCGACGVTIR